jgi:NADH:ubiquinone oxidoreductase subunit 3 (subunit A)
MMLADEINGVNVRRNVEEKASIYECGHSSYHSNGKFMTRYYIIGLIFLIFDIEMSLVINFAINTDEICYILVYIVMNIIIISTVYEILLLNV